MEPDIFVLRQGAKWPYCPTFARKHERGARETSIVGTPHRPSRNVKKQKGRNEQNGRPADDALTILQGGHHSFQELGTVPIVVIHFLAQWTASFRDPTVQFRAQNR